MLVLFICVLALSALADVAQCAGYTRISSGWVKTFSQRLTWEQARARCYKEGAVLASPLDEELLREMTPVRNGCDSRLLTGIHALFHPERFVSIEGVPLSDMAGNFCDQIDPNNGRCMSIDQWGVLRQMPCSNALGYACYKKRTQDMELTECGSYDPQYKLLSGTGACYKVHLNRRNWTEAYAECLDEEAHLVIPDSTTVAHLCGLLSNMNVTSNLYAGTRQLEDGGAFFNVHGAFMDELLSEGNWSSDKTFVVAINPNNCILEFLPGDKQLPFVCEKDPHDVKFPQEEHPTTEKVNEDE